MIASSSWLLRTARASIHPAVVVLVLLVLLPVIMPGPMMIDMSISSTGIMLIMMVPPMIGAAADDRRDDRQVPATMIVTPACRSCR